MVQKLTTEKPQTRFLKKSRGTHDFSAKKNTNSRLKHAATCNPNSSLLSDPLMHESLTASSRGMGGDRRARRGLTLHEM